jgi:hypothetical protein
MRCPGFAPKKRQAAGRSVTGSYVVQMMQADGFVSSLTWALTSPALPPAIWVLSWMWRVTPLASMTMSYPVRSRSLRSSS